MKKFKLTFEYNGVAESWEQIRNDAENNKIKNVFIGTKEFVNVVRCKECKWFDEFCDEYKQESRKDGMCEHPKFGRYTLNTTFDYYCADGEERDA